ncbi:hypothetical protein KCU83_g237, partial [Aureobasidium melanogenum]
MPFVPSQRRTLAVLSNLALSATALSCVLRSLAHLANSSCALTAFISRFKRTTSFLSRAEFCASFAVGVGSLL